MISLSINLFGVENCNLQLYQNQIKEAVYISANDKGFVEILIIKALSTGTIKEVLYATSKSRKQTKLIIVNQSIKGMTVKFPGGKAVYKIQYNGEKMICNNPDKTTQEYFLSETGLDWEKTKYIDGTLIEGGVDEGGITNISILNNKMKEIAFTCDYNPTINGKSILSDENYESKLLPEYKGKKIKITYKKNLTFSEGGSGVYLTDKIIKIEFAE